MSLDTKYRPRDFDEVVGQEGTINVLRGIVKASAGFRQSYLFAGSHGSGKTTLGRILARAILCDTPVEGSFCGTCASCLSFETNTSDDFVEVDAATHSGKDDMKRITDQLQYSTFSGKRRIYLFDEAHQLSRNALDAILKPMEDPLPGTEDKKLVCIFCTTEPEKMRTTILSRCAPAFVIRKASVDLIVDRLVYVCDQENISYDRDALSLVVEITKSHIRDALKSVEGISMTGAITTDNVKSYLHVDAAASYVDILLALGTDIEKAFTVVDTLTETTPPSVMYEKLAEMAMLAYRILMGHKKVPGYLDLEALKSIGITHGDYLIQVASTLASKPGRPTSSMLLCDLSSLHHARTGNVQHVPTRTREIISMPEISIATPKDVVQERPSVDTSQKITQTFSPKPSTAGTVRVSSIVDGVNAPPESINKHQTNKPDPTNSGIDPDQFFELVCRRVKELSGKDFGLSR